VVNFESARLKVSDADGNPVEIAAVIVFRVQDSYKAVFAVDDHLRYVAVQAETAVRHLARPTRTSRTGTAGPACATAPS
jgi:regulator of protease activity HflC (stomatin/prohibitin superfamily)